MVVCVTIVGWSAGSEAILPTAQSTHSVNNEHREWSLFSFVGTLVFRPPAQIPFVDSWSELMREGSQFADKPRL